MKSDNISKETKASLNIITRERRMGRLKTIAIIVLAGMLIVIPTSLSFYFLSIVKEGQQVVVLDPEANLYLTSIADVETSQELIYWSAGLATQSLLQRNSRGLNNEDLARQVYIGQGLSSLNADIVEYKKVAQKVKMRWELSVGKMTIVRDSDPRAVRVKVEGTIYEHTDYANVISSKSRRFVLGLYMARNGDMLKKGRMPYLVNKYTLILPEDES